MRELILASQSKYRALCLRDAGLQFSQIPSNFDESTISAADPGALSAILAQEKCLQVAANHPNSIVIGSDQVAWCDNTRLSKPVTFENACAQLAFCQDKEAAFYTSVCVARPNSSNTKSATVLTTLKFRSLSTEEITTYVQKDQPLDCAGSFKIEENGIHLFEYVRSDDPTALIGLPMLATLAFLRELGIHPLEGVS